MYGEDTESTLEAVLATAGMAWGSSGMDRRSSTQRERAASRKAVYAQVSREQHEFVSCKFEC